MSPDEGDERLQRLLADVQREMHRDLTKGATVERAAAWGAGASFVMALLLSIGFALFLHSALWATIAGGLVLLAFAILVGRKIGNWLWRRRHP